MAFDLVAAAHENEGFAIMLYDQFREVGNTLSGLVLAIERHCRAAGDDASANILDEEYFALRDLVRNTDVEDIDEQARLMTEWRSIISGLWSSPYLQYAA